MFNAWTEGGFIALSQEPDPETGRTPLQLFMDGRAQAAYDVSVFSTWGGILSGGPTARSVQMRKQQFTVDDYAKIGQWINKQLQQRFVWVVLMPQTPQTTVMTTALEQTENWRIVFLNNKQKLFVDVTKPRGKELFDGVLSGKTIFSDEFTRNLTYAYHAFAYGEGDEMKKRGLKHAVKALEIYPSVRPMQQIVMAGRHFYSVRNRGYKICEKFIYDFEQGQEGFAKEHGYQQRLAAVIGACSYLQSVGKTQKNTPAYEAYTEKKATHLKTINELIEAKKW